MTSQQISVFLCVAACRSFTQAGEQLFLSQSVISYHIRALEKELGFLLLMRNTHAVCLTPAGESFYRSMQVIDERTKEAVTRARGIADKEEDKLRICFANPVSPTMMGEIVNRICSIPEMKNIELIRRSYEDVLEPLLQGAADILLSYPHFFREKEGLSMKRFCRVWTSCMVCPGHPLSGKKSLTLSDLQGERLLFPDCRNIRIEFGEVYEYIRSLQEDAARKGDEAKGAPFIDPTPQTFEQVQGLAMAGRGVMLVRTMDNLYHGNTDGLVCIPLRGVSSEYMVAIWKEGDLGALGKRFLQSIPQLSQD